jgi:hypothetical protein
MPVPPSTGAASAQPAAPAAIRRLGGGETCVLIASITAVTVLAILQRPVPAVLTALVAAVCLLLLPDRASRLLVTLASLASGSQE